MKTISIVDNIYISLAENLEILGEITIIIIIL